MCIKLVRGSSQVEIDCSDFVATKPSDHLDYAYVENYFRNVKGLSGSELSQALIQWVRLSDLNGGNNDHQSLPVL
jgi:hypothetical protein